MKHVKQFILALTIAAVPQTGNAFAATNGLSVNPVNGVVFEVNDWRGAGAPAFWCAAANYARRQLKAGWKTKLYVVRSKGPSTTSNRGFAVHYTIDPGAAGVTASGPSNSLEQFLVGDNMSLQQANSYCR